MQCEYCGSILKDTELTGTCPHCGALVPVVKKNQRRVAVVGDMPDEGKRQKLKQSGCRYCPHCLSTNISKGRLFPSPQHVATVLTVCFLTWGLLRYTKWVLVAPVLIILYMWLLSSKLHCPDCGLVWFPVQAKVYEKYRKQLHGSLGNQSAVQCPGINQQTITMYIDRVTVNHPPKRKTDVRYDKLIDVVHREPSGDLFGSLSVRDRATKNIPIPQTYDAAQKDRLTVLYDPQYTAHYRTMYTSLKSIADENNQNGE